MAFSRRRHHNNNNRRLVRSISAVSGAILLLFALLSFLAPSPVDLRHRLHRSSRASLRSGIYDALRMETSFRVPTHGGVLDRDLWSSGSSNFYYGCSNSSKKFAKAESITRPNRYLMIATSGGLNQQRTGITDSVVAARILNATLVVPKLDQKSFWKDASNFSEIFDVDWFISFLSEDVIIIKQLPKEGGRKGKPLSPYTMRVPRKCSARCYENRVLPVLMKKRVVAENPGLPCFCFGHSTGGAIVLKAVLDPKVESSIAGVVVTSPAVGMQPSHPIFVVLAPIMSFLLPRYQFSAANKRGVAVSRDPEALVAKYSDPLVYTGSIRVRTGYEILRISSSLQQNLSKLRVPFIVLHGTDDKLTDPKASQKLYEEASSVDKSLKLYEGLLHDLLIEPEKEDIMKEIIEWLDCRLEG